jgi:putative ABC transport system substrate-binding protein
MERRTFMGLISGGLVATPLVAEAQRTGKVARIGFLSPASPSDAAGNPSDLAVLFAAFRERLRELGYVEGQNIKIESRWAEGNYDRLPGFAADHGTPAAQAAKRATGTIPIVMALIIDPVASGLVTSLARPGGNLTGQSMMSPDLAEKQLEILKEVVPKVSRVAVLHNPANPGNALQVRHARDTARALGVRHWNECRGTRDSVGDLLTPRRWRGSDARAAGNSSSSIWSRSIMNSRTRSLRATATLALGRPRRCARVK